MYYNKGKNLSQHGREQREVPMLVYQRGLLGEDDLVKPPREGLRKPRQRPWWLGAHHPFPETVVCVGLCCLPKIRLRHPQHGSRSFPSSPILWVPATGSWPADLLRLPRPISCSCTQSLCSAALRALHSLALLEHPSLQPLYFLGWFSQLSVSMATSTSNGCLVPLRSGPLLLVTSLPAHTPLSHRVSSAPKSPTHTHGLSHLPRFLPPVCFSCCAPSCKGVRDSLLGPVLICSGSWFLDDGGWGWPRVLIPCAEGWVPWSGQGRCCSVHYVERPSCGAEVSMHTLTRCVQ